MKDKIGDRFEELKAKSKHLGDFYALESYELVILQSLHDSDGRPNFDDLEDYHNILKALNRVQSLIIEEITNNKNNET